MDVADQHADAALQLWPREIQDAILVRLLAEASRIKMFQGASQQAAALGERAVALAEQLGDPGLLSRAIFALAGALGQTMQRPGELVPLLNRGIALAFQTADWRTLSRICLSRANHRGMLGDLEGELADRRQALESAERSGETERVAYAHQTLSSVLTRLGRWEEARAAARARISLDPGIRVLRAPVTGVLAWLEGRHGAALDELLACMAAARQRRDLQGVLLGLAWFSTAALRSIGRQTPKPRPAKRSRWPGQTGVS
jgi:tetratricopeptide (TPR) repeat protein